MLGSFSRPWILALVFLKKITALLSFSNHMFCYTHTHFLKRSGVLLLFLHRFFWQMATHHNGCEMWCKEGGGGGLMYFFLGLSSSSSTAFWSWNNEWTVVLKTCFLQLLQKKSDYVSVGALLLISVICKPYNAPPPKNSFGDDEMCQKTREQATFCTQYTWSNMTYNNKYTSRHICLQFS